MARKNRISRHYLDVNHTNCRNKAENSIDPTLFKYKAKKLSVQFEKSIYPDII